MLRVARPRSVALDVGRDAQVALHGAAIDLAGRGAFWTAATSRISRLLSALAFLMGRVSTCCGRFMRCDGDLHLHLVVDARLRVAPVVPGHVAAGRSAHQQGVGHVLDGHAAQARLLPIDVDADGRVVELLVKLHVAERREFLHFRQDLQGMRPHRVALRPGPRPPRPAWASRNSSPC